MPRALAFVLAVSLPAFAQNAPVPAKDAASRMTLPEGFKVTLFAGEPDVVQPIAFAFDDRGRLWVVENHSYPDWKGNAEDRVLIFEDTDNDGHFDIKKVFFDKGQNLSGINLGYGGVWLCSTPNFVFIPDKNNDDTPDDPPQVLLDGWDLKAKHNVFNSLVWGPDGWLYGCNGIMSNSRVGAPGTPDKDRVAINCGVWRYHPTRKTFEAVAHGTTNPWGLDYDKYGQFFFTNCVIKHAWQVIPGANYERMYGQPFNPNLYELMKSQSDHVHWNGIESWSDIRSLGVSPTTDRAGGGHAHSGAMIYLGDNWPAEYRNNLFTCNIHGNRINRDRLEPKGSGYTITHAPDFLFAHDPWFRGLALGYGGDGGVYVADWSDTGECHDYDDIHRENGRIYKITYGKPTYPPSDLTRLDQEELIGVHCGAENQWTVRHARRLLAERAAAGTLERRKAKESLWGASHVGQGEPKRLDAIWTLHACDLLEPADYAELLKWVSPHVTATTIRLMVDRGHPGAKAVRNFAELAASEHAWHPAIVRLALTSALQRLPIDDRWEIAGALAARGEDADDPNIPLMLWYAVEPMVSAAPDRALRLAWEARIPLVRRFIARRYASLAGDRAQLSELIRAIAASDAPAIQADLLEGAIQGLSGRKATIPGNWPPAYAALAKSPSADVRHRANRLALILGDPSALAATRAIVADAKAPVDDRLAALEGLVSARDPGLAPLLHRLLDDRAVRGAGLRALASTDHPETAALLLKAYSSLDPSERGDAVATLTARPASALALIAAIESGTVPKTDISPSAIQALAGYADPKVKQAVARVWGSTRPSPAEKKAIMARLKAELTPDLLAKADRSHGRAVFAKTCASCHTLFDAGGKIGPELTGAQRTDLDYVLTNVIDPSAVVGNAFQVSVFATGDGRVISGIVRSDDANTLVVQTANDVVVIPKSDLEARRTTPQSLMPEGLVDGLSRDEIRDLVAYLASPVQLPMPPGR
jgi:putative membrane-bound dehydrogenase-like protein